MKSHTVSLSSIEIALELGTRVFSFIHFPPIIHDAEPLIATASTPPLYATIETPTINIVVETVAAYNFHWTPTIRTFFNHLIHLQALYWANFILPIKFNR